MGKLIDADAVLALWEKYHPYIATRAIEFDGELMSLLLNAQPEAVVKCKDCKHWKDSDGVYRRGSIAESKCPLNLQVVYDGDFYCGLADRRTDDEKTD